MCCEVMPVTPLSSTTPRPSILLGRPTTGSHSSRRVAVDAVGIVKVRQTWRVRHPPPVLPDAPPVTAQWRLMGRRSWRQRHQRGDSSHTSEYPFSTTQVIDSLARWSPPDAS
ncbi:hypothetical protein E2C01_038275 [Portunus trituberculatus]|uniref:Uncharacterized protein n=1 Tax=Portunus trituberculatus TaxID=210409 RepID=A0A5B7FGE2_PORTR|nr:hypothetical protein [Portunus trituberculatus]